MTESAVHLAVDLGHKRIGLAISDDQARLAVPLEVLTSVGQRGDVSAVATLARAHGADVVVVGLPLNMDDSEGPMCAKARAFADALTAEGFAVILADERLSSHAARDRLGPRAAKSRPGKRANPPPIDARAASIFLQSYLDGRRARLQSERFTEHVTPDDASPPHDGEVGVEH